MNGLRGLRVAFLVTDGIELVELLEPRRALDAAGAETAVVSPKRGTVRGRNLMMASAETRMALSGLPMLKRHEGHICPEAWWGR